MEFHDVTRNLERLQAFLARVNGICRVVHLHANNAAAVVDGVPEVVELSLETGTYAQQRQSLPLSEVDSPNNPNKPDIAISF